VPGCLSNDPVACPALIPIGARNRCDYPGTPITRSYDYVCDYRLPCGEIATCTCIPNEGRWICNRECPDAQPQVCALDPATYACQACSGYSSAEACLIAESKTRK